MIPFNLQGFNDDMNVLEDRCVSNYIMHEGLEVIPVLGPRDTPPVIVRLHSAYTERRANFNYARPRVPPLVPPPGDTLRGDKYIGGGLAITAPTQNASGELVYRAGGEYNFVTAADIRTTGLIRFDAHGYRSKIDFLGWFNLAINPNVDDTWNSPFFDLNFLGSARILG